MNKENLYKLNELAKKIEEAKKILNDLNWYNVVVRKPFRKRKTRTLGLFFHFKTITTDKDYQLILPDEILCDVKNSAYKHLKKLEKEFAEFDIKEEECKR